MKSVRCAMYDISSELVDAVESCGAAANPVLWEPDLICIELEDVVEAALWYETVDGAHWLEQER